MKDSELEAMADAMEANEFLRRARRLEDFRYDEIQGKYWDTTTGNLLVAKSVDGAIPRDWWPTRTDGRSGKPRAMAPSTVINDVSTGLTVEGSTWWPGQPRFIENVVVTDRGPVPLKGAVTYNSYVPPDHSQLANNQNPDAWIQHVKMLWPDPVEHEHFFDYAAHMIQRPDEKVNHGIVMAGSYGIGKDTALLPLRAGVGEWNTAEIPPDDISRQYNGYVKSVLLVINEVRPHDEDHKASNFYNELKPILAAPPEMIGMEMKYANVIYVRNLCHVVLTTNDPLTMYIPPDDRRLFVMTSDMDSPKAGVWQPYFEKMYKYFANGGTDAVVRWLQNRDLSEFNSGSPPMMTEGKRRIIESSNQVRRTVVDEVLEQYLEEVYGNERPPVIFMKDLHDYVNHAEFFDDKIQIIKSLNAKNFHFKMAERGYQMYRNPHAKSWRNGKYESRMAFLDKAVPQEDWQREVEAALAKRPLAFDLN